MYRLQNIRMLTDANHLVGVNIEDMSDRSLDEARFNLATHVMSNGVELIIASDKVKHNDKQVSSSQGLASVSARPIQQKPVTLAPSTLKNHMILALPTIRQESFTIPVDENQFITKTCLTTYTYHKTYLNKGTTTVESREKIVSNRYTEERNFLRASTQLPLGVTLSNTLDLVVGIFPTTYHYYNTLRNNDYVVTSSYTIINTVTGPEGYISYLQPSEEATPLLETNTYYSPLTITKTVQDGSESMKVVTDENMLTQVVITESIPPRGATRLQSAGTPGSDNNNNNDNQIDLDVHIYATKTYFTTLTYVATPVAPTAEGNTQVEALSPPSQVQSELVGNFHTKVIVNIMTDIVPSSLLRPELVSMFRTELMQKKGKNNRKVLVTLATLVGGETLQVTAVNMPPQTTSDRMSSSASIAGITIKPSTVANIGIDQIKTQTHTDSEDQTVAESENKDVYVRPLKESAPAQQSSAPTVDQLIGSLNLQRFRPVFDVMAELLQKKIANRQTPQTKQNSVILNDKKNQTSQSLVEEKPVYIPLQDADTHKLIRQASNPQQNSLGNYKSEIKSSDNKAELNLSRLTAHSLHINPPEPETELDFPDTADENSWLVHQNKNILHSPESVKPFTGYQSSLLNNGISIRPGEIINANADVIIGRPNGIGAQFLRPSSVKGGESLTEYIDKSAFNYNVPPFKKKTWISPPQIPLSLTPPRIIPLVATGAAYKQERFNPNPNRLVGDDYTRILRPPSSIYPVKPLPNSLAPSAVHNHQMRLPIPFPNHVGHLYGSQQLIVNLNSELNNNEILEIKQIPQIFSTNIPAVTMYPLSESSYDRPKASIPPHTYSAHHHINLKTDVLSHNVNMNVPPLTFKKESENFPLAAAVRGHIVPQQMPLIKIPLNKANVEVRLTPQNTQLAIEPPEPDQIRQAASTFKQRNQNFFKNTESLPMHRLVSGPNASFSSKTISSNKGYTNTTIYPSITKKFNPVDYTIITPNHTIKQNISETRMKWNEHFSSSGTSELDQSATNLIRSESNKQPNLVYLGPIYQSSTDDGKGPYNDSEETYSQLDQKAEYTTYNSNYKFPSENISLISVTQLPNMFSSIENIYIQKTANRPTANPWISLTQHSNQTLSLGHPFIKQNHNQLNRTLAPVKSDAPKKVFVASGESFNLRLQPKPKPIATSHNVKLADSNTVKPSKIKFGAAILSPPPMPTYLKKTIIPTLNYDTAAKQDVLGMHPPPPPAPPTAVPTRPATPTMKEELQPTIMLPPPSSKVISSSQTQLELDLKDVSPKKTTSSIFKHPSRLDQNQQTSTVSPRSSVKRTEHLSIIESSVTESTAIKIQPTPETITKTSLNKFLTDSKLKQPIIISSIDRALIPTHTYNNISINNNNNKNHNKNKNNNTNKIKVNNSNTNSNNSNKKNININYHNNKSIIQDSTLLLESSEAAVSTEMKTQFTIGDIKSKVESQATVNQNKVTDILDDATVIKMQSIILKTMEPVSSRSLSAKKEMITQSAITSSHAPRTSATLIGDTEIVPRITKSRLADYAHSKLKPHTLTPTTTTSKIRPDISSILVVMTKATGTENSNIIDLEVPLDYDSNISFDIPTRDEEILPPINANSVLLGGILIATPSKTQYTEPEPSLNSSDACNPACKSNKNEICASISGYGSRCECRLGFARMFPDRPCKPTYTYEMQISINRVGSYLLRFSDEFVNNSSNQYRHLSSIILDAIDRMVMQSDFRDVYYGVQLKDFNSNDNDTVLGNFLLQLSENSDEKRLETVFKKYLRQSNYSIGGTELHTSKEDINYLTIKDFDECANVDFNDCSTHAHCFNLVGSYTCSCPDGFADISDNPIYPGRRCADHIIGCSKCNYHGNCVSLVLNVTPVCECFAWYTGATCQLNLKILLISIIAIGTVFVLLLVCMLLIYSRRKWHGGATTRPIFITTSNYHPSMLTTSSNKSGLSSAALIRKCSLEKHAILNDSHSESSHNSELYSFKDSSPCAVANTEPEQSDRSLTVMIPRAKYYHPTVLPHAQLKQHELTLEKCDKTAPSKGYSKAKGQAGTSAEPCVTQSAGALVSAGFEVSAIVSNRAVKSDSIAVEWTDNGSDRKLSKGHQKQQKLSRANLEAILHSEEEIHRMSSWMSNIPANTVSADVRSFDETTVQAVTKSMHICFDKQAPTNTNEGTNTMAERDIGSTFLLPHTHLYKPEKLESDLSGFDSL